LPANLSL